MTAYVFVGPTLKEQERPTDADIVYLPPVEQGHVYAVCQRGPSAIGIIDGRFHDVPSVWHKEILWALDRGIPIYGSASMGALRAAELSEFGMRGVGAIFEAYKDGSLEDDDEVTVAHAGPEDGFVQTSDAMVNIRASLAYARKQGCIEESTHDALLAIAKEQFYAQRSLRLALRTARESGVPASELDLLASFLKENFVDQKKKDAVDMVRTMTNDLRAGKACTPRTAFARNAFFDRALSHGVLDVQGEGFLEVDRILNELRLSPLDYIHVHRQVVARFPWREDSEKVRADTSVAVGVFRETHGIESDAEWDSWLRENSFSSGEFESLVRETVADRDFAPYGDTLNSRIFRHVRMSSSWGAIRKRAIEKKVLLGDHGLADPASSPFQSEPDGHVMRWYFESAGIPVPADLDRYAKGLGFLGVADFLRALREEYWFRTADQTRSSPDGSPRWFDTECRDDLACRVLHAVWQSAWRAK